MVLQPRPIATAGVPATMPHPITILDRPAVYRHLPIADCIDALARALGDAEASRTSSLVAGAIAPAGTFHVKAALATVGRPLFAAKLNANFPGNPARGLPTIQGVLVLSDAENGCPLALMDSGAITVIRTAAASGLVARLVARPGASVVGVVGCGAQAEAQVSAMCAVRPIRAVRLLDTRRGAAADLAARLTHTLGIEAVAAASLDACVRGADIVVTCTTAREPFLDVTHVAPGMFVAAVGADSPDKNELTPALMAAAAIVVDNAEQCLEMGDLRHAVRAGVVNEAGVWRTLPSLLRESTAPPDGRPVVFDSTGIPLQDVAAAALVYERAVSSGDVRTISLS